MSAACNRRRSSQLNARVTGFLEAQDFKNGDTVARGSSCST